MSDLKTHTIDREALATADLLLSRWGRLRAEEVEDECGLPRVSPSCAGYSSPPGIEDPPRTGITQEDMQRVVVAMGLLSGEHWGDYKVLREHYRDNVSTRASTLDRARGRFMAVWRALY